jgi:hypothetical protein
MTIQEELEIYQRMLKAFRKQYWRPFKSKYYRLSGFCTYYGLSGFCTYLILTKNGLYSLNELSILTSLKPIKTYDRGYWFKPHKMSPRIKLLKKAIKICKQQLKLKKHE